MVGGDRHVNVSFLRVLSGLLVGDCMCVEVAFARVKHAERDVVVSGRDDHVFEFSLMQSDLPGRLQ
eukprot:13315175-Heterocapsa_arctica.AAC.1